MSEASAPPGGAGTGPVVIGYDGSAGAREAIAQAARTLGPGREAVVVTVWASLTGIAPAAVAGMSPAIAQESVERVDGAAEAEARKSATEGAEAARAAGFDAEARTIQEDGSAWIGICRVAEEVDASVIVVGSRGLSGVKSVLLGSVSRGVVHHADRPVLVARQG